MAMNDNVNLFAAIQNLEIQEQAVLNRRKIYQKYDAFNVSDRQFMQMFRLNKELANNLIEIVTPFIREQRRTSALSPKDKVGTDQEIRSSSHNESSSIEIGAPDSHEAMNNRQVNLNIRDKRSYEFLMGLINNNSKYEMTKIDPSIKAQQISQEDDANAAASELLLELLVKIAAHPDHWNRVHNLLERIDDDILTSKKIVDDLQNAKIKVEPKPLISIYKKENRIKKNNKTENKFMKNQWPTFQEEVEMNNKVTFVNTATPENHRLGNTHKTGYPRTFAYHRVTGRPMYLNKNPKAYIAVSVIAPKPMNGRSKDEDLILEKELRQLKPWTHNQNLKNMASIRSRWVIQSDNNKKDTIAP